MALAHTPTMQFGQIEKLVVTSKKFMVNTNLPRFVRTGDKVVLQATINNLTSEIQQGEAYLELFVPSTNAVISKQQVTFNVKAQSAWNLPPRKTWIYSDAALLPLLQNSVMENSTYCPWFLMQL